MSLSALCSASARRSIASPAQRKAVSPAASKGSIAKSKLEWIQILFHLSYPNHRASNSPLPSRPACRGTQEPAGGVEHLDTPAWLLPGDRDKGALPTLPLDIDHSFRSYKYALTASTNSRVPALPPWSRVSLSPSRYTRLSARSSLRACSSQLR